jgi:serralysin
MITFGCACCNATLCREQDAWWQEDNSVTSVLVYAAERALETDGLDLAQSSNQDQILDNTLETRDFAIGPASADTIPGGTSSSSTISVGNSVIVDIETIGDRDWYRLLLTADRTYTIHSSNIHGSNTDAFLNLRSSTGTVIQSDDDSGDGINSLISFTPTTSGFYYIDAGTYNSDTTGTFRLSVSAAPLVAIDPIGGISTSATLGVGNGINGTIDSATDHDYYRISLVAGESYIFRTGSTTPLSGDNPAGAVDTTLTLRDQSGVQLKTNDDAGEYAYSGLRFTATTTGTYYLDVGGFSGAPIGQYNLTAYTTVPLTVFTNDQIANQLTTGYWGGSAHRFNATAGSTITYNVAALTAGGQTLARAAIGLWSDVTGITFTEVASGGQIVYDDDQPGAFAEASFSAGITTGATVNIETAWLTTYGTNLNSYSFQTYLHETGHALGLGHGGNYDGNANYGVDALYLNDAWATTVMSYFDQSENDYFGGQGFTRQFLLSPMVADGIAIAALYGTATTTRTGNTTYGFNNNSGRAVYDATENPSVSYTVFDNGGSDTLDYSGFSQTQRIDLNQETFSNVGGRTGNISIARGSAIENAIGGSGNDTIIGNGLANQLDLSRGGVDTANAGDGNDAIIFGATLTAADTVDGGTGNDQLGITGNYTGANALVLGATTLANVELLAALPGGSYDITLNDANTAAGATFTVFGGNLGASETFTVNASAETNGTIITYAGLGTDTITGGAGSDGFYFGPSKYGASDTVTGGAGTNDQLALDGDYTITVTSREDVEVLALLRGPTSAPNTFNITVADSFTPSGQSRTIWGGQLLTSLVIDASAETNGNLTFFGGTQSDTLTGGAGNDAISGGNGGDALRGGLGNDSFRYNDLSQSNGTSDATRDRILDFASGDRIDLSGIDAITGGSEDAFAFIGASAFSNVAGQLRSADNGNGTFTIEGDVNGDSIADLAILVTSAVTLGVGDFVL